MVDTTATRRTALASLLAVVACCAPPAVDAPPVPEPTAALRPAAQRGSVPDASHIIDYVLDARLDADTHQIRGTARITWRNRSSRAVDSLPLHLYMNSFRAEDTAWMLEARGSHRGVRQSEEGRYGYIDLTAARLLGQRRGETPDLQRPEDSGGASTPLTWKEGADPSLASVALPAPVQPGETLTLELEFLTVLPEVFARTGYAGAFHMAGQWFPKLGVLQPDGTWRAHVFTLNSEFYADFGDYDVHLDVPEAMVVGATGILVAADPPSDGRKRLHYRAEMVHDFAWAADPDFVAVHGQWNGVRIVQLMHPRQVAEAPRHLEALVATLESMDRRFGAYPWSTVTIIHPPDTAKGAQGMEYPTLFTTSPVMRVPAWLTLFKFEERFSGIFTTVHEFGHQYFQGLLASDEAAQPWLDEGLNTTSNMLALIDWQGDHAWVARIGQPGRHRRGLRARHPRRGQPVRPRRRQRRHLPRRHRRLRPGRLRQDRRPHAHPAPRRRRRALRRRLQGLYRGLAVSPPDRRRHGRHLPARARTPGHPHRHRRRRQARRARPRRLLHAGPRHRGTGRLRPRHRQEPPPRRYGRLAPRRPRRPDLAASRGGRAPDRRPARRRGRGPRRHPPPRRVSRPRHARGRVHRRRPRAHPVGRSRPLPDLHLARPTREDGAARPRRRPAARVPAPRQPPRRARGRRVRRPQPTGRRPQRGRRPRLDGGLAL